MATYTSNYAWTKPSGNDNVDISVLNANLDSQDSIIHDAFMNMAQAFSELSTYEVDDIVVYGTTTYKCHTAVTTAGSWTGSTNWQVYKLSEGGGGGLTLGETSSTAYRGDRGKVAYDHSQTSGNPHGTTAADVGLGNVPNVATNDQTPTFTEASTRNNIASGEKLSIMLGKIAKFFNDLKTVAFSGSFSDLSNKPSINSVELSGNKTSAQLSLQNASTEITWAQWIQKTPQEQETGDWRITDCPWADGDVSIDLMTKLWENPSPTSAFAAQNITLSSNDYDLLLIGYNPQGDRIQYSICGKGTNGLSYSYASNTASQGVVNNYRAVTIDGTVTVSFDNCTTGSTGSAATQNNSRIVPLTIYGIKTTASVKINAIALDVSTSADKCMLSDGVTSVEEKFNSYDVIYEVTGDGIKTYSQLFDELYPYAAPGQTLNLSDMDFISQSTYNFYTMALNAAGDNITARFITLKASGSVYKTSTLTWTLTDRGSGVVTSGVKIQLRRYH